MKKSIFALSTLLLAAVVALAAMPQTTEKSSSQGAKSHSGEVVSVDAAQNRITIKDQAGKETTLLISTDTKITKEGKAITLADIKAGDQVSSDCEESAEGCKAKSVRVTPGKSS